MEELEAIDWYDQEAATIKNSVIVSHNRNPEMDTLILLELAAPLAVLSVGL
jgi:hypothetical protein